MPDNKDPRNIGTSGLRGISGIDRLTGNGSMEESIRLGNQMRAKAPSVESVGYVGAGDSSYERGKDLSARDFYNLPNYRGEQQGWLTQLANGLAKGVVLAGTTFLDGTVGLVIGIGTAINEGRLSGLFDNDFSRAMKQVNGWAEEAMPNYYTDDERENPFAARNIFSGNFIGDKLIKNMGFTIGAFYSGSMWAKPLQAINFIKNAGIGAHVATGLGATISAINEGRIEAINNSTDWFNLEKAKLDDAYTQQLEKLGIYQDTTSYPDLVNQLNEDYRSQLEDIQNKSLHMGNTDMLLNLPILLASNIIQCGRLYAKGFDTANKGLNIAKTSGKYAADYSKAGRVWQGIKSGLSEGQEEVLQQIASNTSGYMYQTDGYDLSFNRAVVDSNTNDFTVNWIKDFGRAALEGTKTAFGEDFNDTMEQFLIGSLTGILGMPTFGRSNNADSWLGKNKLIGLQGGAVGEIQNYNKQWADAQQLADELNKRIQDPNFKNYYQSLLRHNKFQNDMNRAANEGKVKEYKDAEYAQLISDVAMFAEAGKIDDLITLVNEAADTSDENLESIIRNTTSTDENGKSFGPFVDDNNNPLTATEEGKQNMIDSIKKRQQETLTAIDKYRKYNSDLVQRFGESLSREQRQELVWLRLLSENSLDRAGEIAENSKAYIRDLIEDYTNRKSQLEVEQEYNSTDTEADRENRQKKIDNLQKNINILEKFTSMNSKELAFQIAANPQLITAIGSKVVSEIVNTNENNNLDKQRDFIQGISDITNLTEDSQKYAKKLKEYLENPAKLEQDQQKEVKQEAKKSEEFKSKKLQDRINNAQSFDEIRQALADSEDDDSVKRDALNNGTSQTVKDFNLAQKRLSSTKTNVAKVTSDIDVITDANELVDNALKRVGSIGDIVADSELFSDPIYLSDKQGETPEQKEERAKKAQDAIRQALDLTIKDEQNSPSTDSIIEAGNPVEGNPEDIDEGGNTSSVDSGIKIETRDGVTSYSVDKDVYEGGQIPPRVIPDSSKEDNEFNPIESAENSIIANWYPEVAQYDLTGMERGFFGPNTNADWQLINNYITSHGGFEFCNNGKLFKYYKENGVIYFGIDPTIIESNGNSPIFIFVKDGDNYIPIGNLFENKEKTDTFKDMTDFLTAIKQEFNNRENKEGLWISKTTSKITDVNRGRTQFRNTSVSVKQAMTIEGSEVSTPRIVIIKGSQLVNADNAAYPPNMQKKNGKSYIQVPNAKRGYRGGNTLVPIFPIVISDDVLNIQGSTIINEINTSIRNLAEAIIGGNRTQIGQALRELSANALVANLDISKNNNNNTLFINIKSFDKDGNVTKERVEKPNGKIEFYEKTTNFATLPLNNADVERVENAIKNAIIKNSCRIRINANKLTDEKSGQSYTNDLVNNELVNTFCPVLRVESAYPYIAPPIIQQTPVQPVQTPQQPVIQTPEVQQTQQQDSQPTEGGLSNEEKRALLGDLADFDMGFDEQNLGSSQEENVQLVEQTKKQALRQLAKILPQIAKEKLVQIVDEMYSTDGHPLNGMVNLSNCLITLARLGEKGTIYHEAYHIVSRLLLTDNERSEIYRQARQMYGEMEDRELEERLADGFRDYMNNKRETILDKVKNWFKRLANIVMKRQVVISSIPQLYDSIAQGLFANRELSRIDETLTSQGDMESRINQYLSVVDRYISDYGKTTFNKERALYDRVRDINNKFKMSIAKVQYVTNTKAKIVITRPTREQVRNLIESVDKAKRETFQREQQALRERELARMGWQPSAEDMEILEKDYPELLEYGVSEDLMRTIRNCY